MPQPEPQAVLRILLILGLAVWASLVVWTWVGMRVFAGEKVVPYQRRRPVPWGGIEVLLLLLFAPFASWVTAQAGARFAGVELARATSQEAAAQGDEDEEEDEDEDVAHPVARLVLEGNDPWHLVLAAVMAVLVAPIIEEILFRLVLQGWLEKVEMRYRRWLPRVLRVLPGMGPVLLTSLPFAAMHFRASRSRIDIDLIVFLLAAQCLASLLTLLVAVLVLRFGSGATLSDMGFVARKLPGDVVLGLLAYLAVTGPIYLVLIAANLVIPKTVSADPIPLVFLAIVLGALYYRTHRIVPSIVLHMAFNATAVVMLVVMAMGTP